MKPLVATRPLILSACIFLLALLSACTDANLPIGSTHPLGADLLLKGTPAFHGVAANDCSKCHEVSSFCSECHFGPGGQRVPPGSTWIHGVFPHNRGELSAVGAVCDRCHYIKLHYEGVPLACHGCHEPPVLPHPMGGDWLSSTGSHFHGRFDLLDPTSCAGCHNTSTFCFTCHFGTTGSRVPPGVVWSHGWSSHTRTALVEFGGVCVKCHAITRQYRSVPGSVTCTGCHEGTFPQHVLPYEALHGAQAKADLRVCRECHGNPGASFEGGVAVVACSTCHPAAKAHPTDWAVGHRSSGNLETACTLCHDVIIDRPPPLASAPSCFQPDFTNADGQAALCHGDGWLPHALPFTDPAAHGAPAKEDLANCQTCHGIPPTTDFGGGSTGVSCAACHTSARAHPTDWRGDGTYSHRTSGNTGTACTLCHDVTGGRTAPDPASPSCFSASHALPGGQPRSCHIGGPGVPHAPVDQFRLPGAHGVEAKKDLTYCQVCHGVPGITNFSGGRAKACSDCHTQARAHPTDWQGTGTYSHRTSGNRPVACALCHNTTALGSGPLAGAPSCFSTSFTNPLGQTRPCHQGGPGVPHLVPAQFAPPAVHGPEAKKDLLYCQKCHGQPGTILFQGGRATACASCHTSAKAHPTDWQGAGSYSHRNALNMETACAACHDYTSGRTPPFTGAPSCFAASFVNGTGQNRTCHPGGPGATHPRGQPWLDKKSVEFHGDSTIVCANCHTVATYCSTCHFGAGGSRVPPGSGWTHARRNHDNYEAYQAVCNACHNVNRTYGNAPGTCHNCH